MANATFKIWRGDSSGGGFETYKTEFSEGMVVLDVVHKIQAEQAPDLAVRWNCKAGKCGSCSAEVNGMPKLMCMTRMNTLDVDQPISIEPMQAFPVQKDLVTDVSVNYEIKKRIKPFSPRPPDHEDGTWRMFQPDVERSQEFRKCIECFLCQDVCHVDRDHHLHLEGKFIGPRYFVHTAYLDMHPADTADRLEDLKRNIYALGGCLFALLAAWLYWQSLYRGMPALPATAELWDANREPAIEFVDRSGKTIAIRGPRYGRAIKIDELPPHVPRAFIAAEDKRFYDHDGADTQAIARAAISNVISGKTVSGASTITQQTVKQLLLSSEQTYTRKIREAVLAYRIEQRFTKQEILFLYLNQSLSLSKGVSQIGSA